MHRKGGGVCHSLLYPPWATIAIVNFKVYSQYLISVEVPVRCIWDVASFQMSGGVAYINIRQWVVSFLFLVQMPARGLSRGLSAALLFGVLITSCTSMREADFASSLDVKVQVANMTSWIQNETIQMYISTHLLICPGQDMCLGPEFKRTHDFKQIPSCSLCSCTNDCYRKNNCCPWRNYRQDETSSPSFVRYENLTHPVSTQENKLPLQCQIPYTHNVKNERIKGYFMISTCPESFVNQERIRKCEIVKGANQYKSYQPVTSLVSNETFRNLDCAICNGESATSVEPWTEKVLCDSQSAIMQIDSLESLNKRVFDGSGQCNVQFIPPGRVSDNRIDQCITREDYISKCNNSGIWRKSDPFIEEACNMNYINTFRVCKSRGVHVFYKNIFCAMCNVGDWRTELPVECAEEYILDSDHLKSFSALLDLSDRPRISKNCEFYDPLLVSNLTNFLTGILIS